MTVYLRVRPSRLTRKTERNGCRIIPVTSTTMGEESGSRLNISTVQFPYLFRNGKIKSADVFKSAKEVELLVARLLKHANKTLPKTRPSAFLSLDNSTAVNIVMPPLAMKGPALNFSKIPNQDLSLDDMIKFKALDEEGKKLIEKIIAEDKSILVAGHIGSGKTTLLNVLIKSIPQPHRVVTLEHFPDLRVNRPKTCRLKTENQDPKEMVDLIRIANKMRADHVALSDCIGPEVMPFLELLRNTCSGGMALISAENIFDAIKRLETKALLSSDGFSLEDVRYAIAQAFQVVVYQERRSDGKRLVSNIAEIKYESGEIKLKVIYKR